MEKDDSFEARGSKFKINVYLKNAVKLDGQIFYFLSRS